MPSIFVYRNCFTGDVSGGDMHNCGVNEWLVSQHPEIPVYLIAASRDGQEKAYPDVPKLRRLLYRAPLPSLPSLSFIIRALFGARVKLPFSRGKNIVVASSHFLPDVWPVFCKQSSRPISRVVYVHHIVRDMPRAKGLNTLLAHAQEAFCFWLIKKRFDKIITVNQHVAERLRELGMRRQSILVSSNFVSPPETPPKPKKWVDKDITMIVCGRLVLQKGVDDFLRIAEFLQQRLPSFSAVMVGAGPEQDRLRREVEHRQLNVRVAGYVPSEEKFELLSRSKLFVFPSVEEGWGIVIAEALSLGVPVFAYKLEVYTQIFDDQLQLSPVGNVEQLGSSVLLALQQFQKDQRQYAAWQRRSMLYAKRFALQAVAEREFKFMMDEKYD